MIEQGDQHPAASTHFISLYVHISIYLCIDTYIHIYYIHACLAACRYCTSLLETSALTAMLSTVSARDASDSDGSAARF